MPPEDQAKEEFPQDDIANDVRAALAEVGNVDETPLQRDDQPEDAAAADERTAAERARDEKGRFAKPEALARPESKTEKPLAPAEAKPQEQIKPAETKPEPQIAPQTTGPRPPPGWSVKSKAEWDKLPEHIRADIAKRETEVNQGFAKLQQYRGLDRYVEQAQRGGTTLDRALEAYTGLEELLRRDPVQGLLAIGQNLGMSPQQMVQLLSGQTGQGQPQQQYDPNDPFVEVVRPMMQPLMQELSGIKQYISQQQTVHQQREMQSAASIVSEFESNSSYPYFSNLLPMMSHMLQSGVINRSGDYRRDLAAAYDAAARLHPEVSEQLVNERLAKLTQEQAAKQKQAVDKARQASRSLGGSPAPGTVVKADDDDDGTPFADARRAYREVMAAR